MEARLTYHKKKALSLGFLLPKLSGQEGEQGKVEEVFDFYEPLFSSFAPQQANEKIEVWSCIWGEEDRLKKAVPMDVVTALGVCGKSVYPIIHDLLQILAIQPASTSSAERSFS